MQIPFRTIMVTKKQFEKQIDFSVSELEDIGKTPAEDIDPPEPYGRALDVLENFLTTIGAEDVIIAFRELSDKLRIQIV